MKWKFPFDFTVVEDALSSCPQVNTDPRITDIIGRTHSIDHCLFGCYLGIPRDDVLCLQSNGDHSGTMIRIFECWDRKTLDLTQRTWKYILTALTRVGYEVLARDLEKEICTAYLTS